jgi:hypothetical protein
MLQQKVHECIVHFDSGKGISLAHGVLYIFNVCAENSWCLLLSSFTKVVEKYLSNLKRSKLVRIISSKVPKKNRLHSWH